ncbi:hypothetical protein KA005_06775 [bacterium]|nr:hypothetical protein [bacterium]
MEWDNRFWLREDHIQRLTCKEWKEVLLEYKDRIIVKGRVRQLVAKNLGYGVVEVSLEPLSEEFV